MKNVFIAQLLLLSLSSYAMTFSEALIALKRHESIASITLKSKALDAQAQLNGSWGDPQIKVAAKNLPKDSFKRDETPMTGIEVGIHRQ